MPCAEQYGLSILPWSPLGFGLLTGKYANGADEPKGARMTSMSDADVMSKWRERSFNERNFEIVDGVRAIADAMGTTPVALAIRWVIEQPVVSSAIIGPRNVEQLEGNWSALDIAFDEETLEQLETLSEPGDNYLEFMQGGVFVRRLSHLE
jgi:aryl-alcohol dehydrogenase (NADP+)